MLKEKIKKTRIKIKISLGEGPRKRYRVASINVSKPLWISIKINVLKSSALELP